jgi:glycine cleavage system H protein
MEIPSDRKYTKEHEWALEEGKRIRVGITDFAQHELGDIVFAELPAVGTDVQPGKSFATVESVKAVSDVYAPVGGRVVERNEKVTASPEKINGDPYGEGWLIVVEPVGSSPISGLMDSESYGAYLKEKAAG